MLTKIFCDIDFKNKILLKQHIIHNEAATFDILDSLLLKVFISFQW